MDSDTDIAFRTISAIRQNSSSQPLEFSPVLSATPYPRLSTSKRTLARRNFRTFQALFPSFHSAYDYYEKNIYTIIVHNVNCGRNAR